MLLQTCDLLAQIDAAKFNELIDDPVMKGRKVSYFSRNFVDRMCNLGNGHPFRRSRRAVRSGNSYFFKKGLAHLECSITKVMDTCQKTKWWLIKRHIEARKLK